MPRRNGTNETHSSYSPQDSPLQAPTRSHLNDQNEHQMGDVTIDDILGGGARAAYDSNGGDIDKSKGKLPVPKSRKDWRPSITEQRKPSLVSRVETAGKDAFRRSSMYLPSEKSVIDALADTLNTWSPGVDRPRSESDRRVSWPERAMSFIFNKDKSATRTRGAAYQATTDGQPDVEYLASDSAYDDLQGAFYVWKDRPDTASTVAKSSSISSYADIVKRGLKHGKSAITTIKNDDQQQKEWFDSDPETARIAVPPRSVPKGNDQELWFDSDPESGRVAVPPLSVSADEKREDEKTSSKLLHNLKGPQGNNQVHEGQDLNIREKKVDWRTRETENYEDTQKTNKFDSDLENWKAHPSSVPHSSSKEDDQRWPEDYQLRDENH